MHIAPIVTAAADQLELTILMPCLNEAETLGRCIAKAQAYLVRAGVVGEVLIADNGSTDGSQAIARRLGARVVEVPAPGYGAALQGGIASARGRYVIMGDSDDSYDFSALDLFVDRLRQGFALVMGNRFKGGIMPGAMPPLHRYLGNPVLTAVGRAFFHAPCGDFHCGLRGFSRAAALELDLQCAGMEFASEMVVKASLAGLAIAEVPTVLSPDGRTRPPHLRSWRDGWRHLRFLLLYSPRWLFLYPGLVMMAGGALLSACLLPGPRTVAGVTFDVHSLLYALTAMVIGYQSVTFWIFARVYGERERIVPPDPRFDRLVAQLGLERGLVAGLLLLLLGLGLGVAALDVWRAQDYGALYASRTLRLVMPSAAVTILAFQTVYFVFFLSFLGIRTGARK